ncbi:hypothetical protein Pcar_3404 [Syntrophotalea carbinolica DSM 2380]|uniref:Bacteriophage T5 Orf172 DNA-binding domain-containing protein n=1 Tax=Syntrophotalea carbinolica (strain DSM 2380 / NBRC 103641 / GraBd1) TaxID=338963 RepID=Q0C6C0_SYNC1|nr:GIY-YIG nuclease family protein [Syntrophotalea carbinolica]ABI82018.1 hypothetical protein Pcar_3404 [Syntrophotalea carbinolica DSM 2380]
MIYIIEEGENGPLKIGFAADIEGRIKTLQVGNSQELNLVMSFEGSSDLENKIHKNLSRHRIRSNGEWFYNNAAVWEYLKTLSTVEPDTEFIGQTEYLVLKREAVDSKAENCPFCGIRHTHGIGDGHRVAHCSTNNNVFIRKSDGKCFEQKKGYIIKTIK